MISVYFPLRSLLIAGLCLLSFSAVSQPGYFHSGGLFDSAFADRAPHAISGLGFSGSLPAAVSQKSYCPPVGDQGQLATCTGWSVAYSALSILFALNHQEELEALASVFNPIFVFNALIQSQATNCMYGVELGRAVEFVVNRGSLPLADYQMECAGEVTNDMLYKAGAYRASGFELLYGYNEQDQDRVVLPVKEALAQNRVVVTNIVTYFLPRNGQVAEAYQPTFWYVGDLWSPADTELDYNQSNRDGYHNVAIVGYDDDKYGGAFEIMNSYGTEWGNEGYFWITYEDFFAVTNGAYSIR